MSYFTDNQIGMLMCDGFTAGFISDVLEGDEVATRNIMDSNITKFVVERIKTQHYADQHGNPRQSVNLVVHDANGLQKHVTHGPDNVCYIKKAGV